ncbi:uncharacterized protein LOC111914700 [Lactuca sativa]|uniref:uncharacterized protein LOC111914700 n=1 Tax=Lactuca sativa TaxID=4236 RepID=UPI0022AED3C6|nr:uncharacterized protein LOC111914700 [Lactuca sativa]
MSERTGRDCTYLFCEYVIELYRDIYLRHPTKSDVEQLYVAHEAKHGFPGMLGSIDCTHWEWANCPNAWRGQFTRGDHGVPTVILEAAVSNDLWEAPDMSYVVNGNEYKYGYYLGDGIYPKYATFVKSFSFPADEKRKLFKLAQESARKDVERAFGVLKQRWHIIKQPARTWDRAKLTTVLTVCVILHNMIIEEEGRAICSYIDNDALNPPATTPRGNDDEDKEDEGDDYDENADGDDEADEDEDDDDDNE